MRLFRIPHWRGVLSHEVLRGGVLHQFPQEREIWFRSVGYEPAIRPAEMKSPSPEKVQPARKTPPSRTRLLRIAPRKQSSPLSLRPLFAQRRQQLQILDPDFDARFAPASVAHPEGEGNLFDRADVPAHQNFQQNFETRWVKLQIANHISSYQEESRHGIHHSDGPLLHGQSHPDRDLRKQVPKTVPVSAAALRSVTAG